MQREDSSKLRTIFGEFLNGNSGTRLVGATLEEAVNSLIQEFIQHENLTLQLDYFSSRDDEMFQIADDITYDSQNGTLLVDEFIRDKDNGGFGEGYSTKYSVKPGEFIKRMKFSNSITLLEVEANKNVVEGDESRHVGKMFLNFTQRAESPMELIPRGPYGSEKNQFGSYTTRTRVVPECFVQY
ncbi:hypothetical protein JXA85_06040 [Candidatus Woesearchaeota archaeon]|nr:hypothetical protein [Candidatus Woesearchaeota archaeon]